MNRPWLPFVSCALALHLAACAGAPPVFHRFRLQPEGTAALHFDPPSSGEIAIGNRGTGTVNLEFVRANGEVEATIALGAGAKMQRLTDGIERTQFANSPDGESQIEYAIRLDRPGAVRIRLEIKPVDDSEGGN